MRLARLVIDGKTYLARVEGDIATPLAADAGSPTADALRQLWTDDTPLDRISPIAPPFSVDDATWLSPLRAPDKIIAIGLNYVDHATEASAQVPTAPMAFTKTNNTLIGHGGIIQWRRDAAEQVDYEGELAAIIGRGGRDIKESAVLDHIAGYTIANDVSARDAQFADGQWTRGKSFDTFCPLGPSIVTAEDIGDPQQLRIVTTVDGAILQDGTTADMVFSIAEIVSYLSRFITFEPGDLILTGTPVGVGFARTPPIFLQHGSEVHVDIDGIGRLSNTVSVTD